MTGSEYRWWVGVDWGGKAHQMQILDEGGMRVREVTVPHHPSGLRELIDWLRQLCGDEMKRVAVGIETPRGPVVEALLDSGVHVYHLNPKQLDRFRDRHSVAGAKDDRLDAFVLAVSLRSDFSCFRRVCCEDPLIVELREASRLQSELLDQQVRLSNRLGAQLHRYWPQLLELVPGADEPWLWSLLQRAARPELARKLSPAAVSKLLRQHRIRRFDAAHLISVLRQPALTVAPGTIAAATKHGVLLVEQLQVVHRQHQECSAWIERLLAHLSAEHDYPEQPRQHRDAEILLSMPGVGKVVAAAVLGEAPQAIADRDYQLLRALTGVAPVTRASGKSRRVTMRRACSARLRYALYHWALNSLRLDTGSRRRYDALRQSGHSHAHALRILSDRHLRILMAMLRQQTLYRGGGTEEQGSADRQPPSAADPSPRRRGCGSCGNPRSGFPRDAEGYRVAVERQPSTSRQLPQAGLEPWLQGP